MYSEHLERLLCKACSTDTSTSYVSDKDHLPDFFCCGNQHLHSLMSLQSQRPLSLPWLLSTLLMDSSERQVEQVLAKLYGNTNEAILSDLLDTSTLSKVPQLVLQGCSG